MAALPVMAAVTPLSRASAALPTRAATTAVLDSEAIATDYRVHHPCRRVSAGPAVAAIPRAKEECAMLDVTITPESRARAVRARLPGQMLHERIENAQLAHGPLYTLAEIRQRVGEALPRRFGYVRSAVLEPIESYRERIPDHALLKYDDAVQSALFDKFWVATPTYYQERQVDPWILGEIGGGADRFAVIARWD